eukprot:CAMPEP_0201165730 /NCGR_PEP_ID=MMETSP0851-20130426/64925_1 /ASSEMBLY_ACC=CAM_ASM_000631 /TAXON_ID=183588 /ORGANISM="Pseudo-nitzschia fraudulenta, Strain WWA7" /LENGTH=313 /DNA_ID=CAMNT_0047446487 /DNA_START=83 /DNA_END=1024 /DNA_ORIENTATION=+
MNIFQNNATLCRHAFVNGEFVTRKLIMSIFVLLSLHLLVIDTAMAKKMGGISSGGSKFTGTGAAAGGAGAAAGYSTGSKFVGSGATYGPVQSSGAGYANSRNFASNSNMYGGRYSQYPGGGYSPFFYSGFFLYGGHRRHNHHPRYKDDDDFAFFNRVENGCELTGVDSYRTIDSDQIKNSSNSSWIGCSEEWKYNVAIVGDSNTSFVSPPLELYACDEGDTCSACQDELRGEKFDALTLTEFDYPNKTYLVDCFMPKNFTLVNEIFDCYNEECIFLSERYDYNSSSATTATGMFYWVVVTSGSIAMAMYSALA